ncbi:tol-pal system YbgF family protein [Elusimicrobiota bacterium]
MLNAINWIKNHKALIGTLSFIVLLAGGVTFAFFYQMKSLKVRSWEAIASAQIHASQGKTQDAIGILRKIQSQHTNRPLGYMATLYDASMLTMSGNWKEALIRYETVLSRTKKQEFTSWALIGKAKSHEAMNELDKAKETYQTFVDSHSDHFLLPEAYEGLARISEVQGKFNEAKENFERIRILFADTSWAQRAEIRLKQLGGTK